MRVPSDYELTIEIWRIAARAVLRDKPSGTQKLQAELIDISTGGVGVVFVGEGGQKPKVCEEDRLRIHFDDWVKLDLEYIDKWSLWLDFAILLRTIPTVIVGFGAR